MGAVKATPSTRNKNMHVQRASPLKIQKDSRGIKKAMNTSSSAPSNHNSRRDQQPQETVIIYTHTPMMVQATPLNFMSLVQELTGMVKEDSKDQKDKAVAVDNMPPSAAVDAKPVHDAGKELPVECNPIDPATNAPSLPLDGGDPPQDLTSLLLPFLMPDDLDVTLAEMSDTLLGMGSLFEPPLPLPLPMSFLPDVFAPNESNPLGVHACQTMLSGDPADALYNEI